MPLGARVREAAITGPSEALARIANMATVRPFRGIRYNKAKVPDLSAVVAPPFDVILPADKELLAARHPNNVVRISLGGLTRQEREAQAPYTRAADHWSNWRRRGILLRDERPAIYAYAQTFADGKRKATRRGFVALGRLEAFSSGTVLPHEQTIAGVKEDRLKLMIGTRANTCPVYMLYPDPKQEVEACLEAARAREPDMVATYGKDERSAMWIVEEDETVGAVVEQMSGRKLYVADGHHRYETALYYRNMVREKMSHRSEVPADYIMMLFVAVQDPGLRILPAHRVVRRLSREVVSTVEQRLERYFERLPFRRGGGLDGLLARLCRESSSPTFGFLGLPSARYQLWQLRAREAVRNLMKPHASLWSGLDVGVLHSVILKEVLGMDLSPRPGDEIEYVYDRAKAQSMVDSGQYQLVIFHNPTRVEQLERAAESGERMPPKSTYFHPKPLSGLVLNSLESF